ncbi:unnamed protein product, partial [Rhizoctonia solani]
MNFDRIFKRGKHKARGSEDRGSLDVPVPGTGARSASPTPGPAARVLGLVTQPFLLRSSPDLPDRQRKDDWSNLEALSGFLNQTGILRPLAEVIDDLCRFTRAQENISARNNEYNAVRTRLEGLCKDLRDQLARGAPPSTTTSMLNLCGAIQSELRRVYDARDRAVISRYLQADLDIDRITECYRCINGHLEGVTLNANLDMLRIVDAQATEARLSKLNPSMAACYDSAAANVVQRRECAPKTREQVLLDLNAWKESRAGERVCWINGMAGTGKTTITTSLCSSLNKDHELGASFFCTRLIPECRDVKLILPTVAYQLARFSHPFCRTLTQVLEQDPDVHTKLPRVQFQRMILEPLQQAEDSLPTRIVVAIDALDECEDGNGVGQILEVLLENASDLPIKFLVSSRPEKHIRDRISGSSLKKQLILHALDEKMVKADIEVYLRTELESMRVPFTSDEIDALAQRAGTLFIYAATVALLDKSSEAQYSGNRTKDIDLLYGAVLAMAFKDDLEPQEKEQMALVLHTIVCAQEPLTVDALARLLNLEYDVVMGSLEPLRSVLHISESATAPRVSTLHASFPEYILDEKRSNQFGCDGHIHNGKLAQLCFNRIARNQPQFNICGLQSSYIADEDVLGIKLRVEQAVPSELMYACQYWATHLDLGMRSKEQVNLLHEFLSQRLLLWMEVLNLKRRMDIGVVQINKSIDWLKDTECLDSSRLLVRDARRFVTLFATSPVSKFTPHIYVSMLSSWPPHQPIFDCYTQRANDLVKIKGLETTERQLSLLSSIPVGSEIRCVVYSSNGAFFAAGTRDNKVLIWDAVTCQMTIDPIQGHTDTVRAIAISPSGTQICSASFDETICIWDPQSGRKIAGPLRGHPDRIWSVDYSPDGRWLASGSIDGTVRLWSTDNWQMDGDPLRTNHGRVFSVAFSPTGTTLAAASESEIYLWDPFTRQRIGEPLKGHTDNVKTLAFLPDSDILVSGSDDHTICVWDVRSRQMVSGPLHGHLSAIDAVTVSPDGKLLVSAALDGTMHIWDTREWRVHSVLRNTGVVRSVRFSPDSSRLVSGSVDDSMRIWEVLDATVGRVVNNDSAGHSDWVASVSFSPCGAYFVSGSSDMTVRHKDWVTSVGVSADGGQIFSVSRDRMINVWERQSCQLEYTVGPIETDGDYDPVYQEFWPAAFIFDNKRVVCGSESGRIYMWEDGEQICELTGHKQTVYTIAVSPDGQTFASGDDGGQLIMWDATQVVSGSSDTTIRMWNVPSSSVEAPNDSGTSGEGRFNDSRGSHTADWTIDHDGWVRNSHEHVLLWVPPDLRSVLFMPQNTAIMSRQGSVEINFTNAKIGDAWRTCYNS